MFNSATNIKQFNTDFRAFYLSDLIFEAYGLFAGAEFDIEKVFILHTNPRFESPIVNIKLRQLATTKNCVYLFGFLSNLNYEFTHITGLGALYQLEALITKSPLKNTLFITRINFTFNNTSNRAQIHRIASNIGSISLMEVTPQMINQVENFNSIELFAGQPNLPCIKRFYSALNMAFLHHVEDTY